MPSSVPAMESPLGFQCAHYSQVPVMGHAHRHQEIEINYLEHGSVTILVNGRLVTQPAGQLAIFWATIPHQVVRADVAAAEFTWITLPLAWLLQWELPDGLVKALLRGEYLLDQSPLAWDTSRIRDCTEMLSRKNSAWRKVALLEIQARLHQVGLRRRAVEKKDQAGRVYRGSLSKVEEIARFLAEHYREPVTVQDVARHTRLHPTYVMSVFRRQSGQTIVECLTQHRIAHAQRLLVTTDNKVLDIALESGFGSLSRFYTAFTASCQATPLQYRKTFSSRDMP